MPADCAATEYCWASSCDATAGVCTKRPVEADGLAAVCGCDQVTYWNETVAGSHGINIAAKGACLLPTCKKGGCKGDAHCSLEHGPKVQCPIESTGTCWVVPKAGCAASTGAIGGPRTKACAAPNKCASYCQAIVDEVPFYTQATDSCP